MLVTRQLEAIKRAHANETDGREAGSLRRPLRRRRHYGSVASSRANEPAFAGAAASAVGVGMIPPGSSASLDIREDAVVGLFVFPLDLGASQCGLDALSFGSSRALEYEVDPSS